MIRPIAKGKEGGAISYIKVPAPIESSQLMLQFQCAYNSNIPGKSLMMKMKLCPISCLGINYICTKHVTCPVPRVQYMTILGIWYRTGRKGHYRWQTPHQMGHIPRVNKGGTVLVEYKELIKHQDESTSSSPLSRHYGHYRAALALESISLVHAQMMSLPFLVSFTPLRWEKAIDCMLEKDPGDPKIDHLKGQKVLDALLLKVVTMDCIRLFWLNKAILNNDASACHDWMIPE
eukprot:2388768-Ditylum_brightwellii.AAC.1